MNKIRAGIMGGAGYTAGELLRLLVHHPQVDIAFVHSHSQPGLRISEHFTDLLGDTELRFSDQVQKDVDVVFLCVAHGDARKILKEIAFSASTKIIDLSQDYRINADDTSHFVYGLPELNREAILKATHIANPGCFATAIQLALLPLAANGWPGSDIQINATTGSTGAGRTLSESSHYSWRSNNQSVYKAFTHQHLKEIQQTLEHLQPGFDKELVFIPQRGAFTRGILACITLRCELQEDAVKEMYSAFYATHPFTHVSNANIDLKQVVNTNKCFLYIEKQGEHLLIVSAIDNLLKGASGQAVQNMNLMFGFDETAGLKLKASAF